MLKRLVIVLAGLCAIASVGWVSAQQASPVPIVPIAAECTRAPRPVEDVKVLVATPASAVAATPPSTGQALTPASPEVASEIEAAIYEFVACTNTGESLRVLAFYSESQTSALLNGVIPVEMIGSLATPIAIATGEETVLVDIGPVNDLGNGIFVVTVIGDDRSNPKPAAPVDMYWTQEGGQWVIVAVDRDSGTATPIP